MNYNELHESSLNSPNIRNRNAIQLIELKSIEEM